MEGWNRPRPSIWSPLKAESFRVLRISQVEPGIDAQLIERRHNDRSPYYALSYACGKEIPNWSISCHGIIVPLTPHLHEGLRCIFELYGPIDLFVDALCIDQHNAKEKAQQVACMYKIYLRATRVLVWLGREEDHSSVAMEYIRSQQYFLPELSQLEDMRGTFTLPGRLDQIPRLLRAIWKLSTRAWYNRLWVLQEVVLAADFDVICGQSKLSGELFTRFAIAMRHGQFLDNVRNTLLIDDVDHYGGFSQFAFITKLRSIRVRHDNSFISSFFSARDRLCTEPVDRIYALLGLDMSSDGYYRENILVDYSSSASYVRVYVGFAKLALNREPFLILLTMASSERRVEGLPSWCPNFNSPEETYIEPLTHYRAGWPKGSLLKRDLQFHQGAEWCRMFKGPFKNHVTTYVTSDKIKIWGCVLDAVQILGPPTKFDSRSQTLSQWYRGVLGWLDDILDLTRTVSNASNEKLPDSYWRTLVGDLNIATAIFPADPSQIELCRLYRRSLDLMCKQAALTGSLNPTIPALKELMAQKDWRSQFDDCIAHLDRTWSNRVFFTTAGGRTGYASVRVRSGDLICAFYGGPSVYVLRQKPDQDVYEYIDSGFTHGLVNGEAFDLLKSGKATEQEFIIE